MDHSVELISPAGKWWQDPFLRDDPNDLIRMTAIILGSGGKFCIGASAPLEGDAYPDQVKQLKIPGEWYRPRKKLFTDSVPRRYRSEQVPGVKASPSSAKTIATGNDGDILLHLVNVDGVTRPIVVEFRGRRRKNLAGFFLEPARKELIRERIAGVVKRTMRPGNIDPVDMILRLKSNCFPRSERWMQDAGVNLLWSRARG
jgi:hypothetical protein